MRKILSFAVPCYNSQDYMRRCIDSLLTGGEEVEIVIVDDGSTDNTAAIADEYQEKFPTICKAVHKGNGGHGDAVNTGLANSTGVFFKVVDSDHRVKKDALKKLLKIMRDSLEQDKNLDMLISNFVYDKQGAKHKKVMRYAGILPENEYFTWEDTKRFSVTKYIIMHSVTYRTELLREVGLNLPKHTFYVDNIFVFQPLPNVHTMYYADVNFYWYYIGREDQSVNENIMIKRIDQQYNVNRIMIDCFRSEEIENKQCRKYMRNYLTMMMTISSILAILSKDKANLRKKSELWKYLKEKEPDMYHQIRWSLLGVWMNFPGHLGRKISVIGYRVVHKIFGFN